METAKKSRFKFLGYKILNSTFKVEDKEVLDHQMQIEFEVKSMLNSDSNLFRLELISKISNKDNTIHIEVDIVGIFKFEKDIPEEMKENFFKCNAPALLFPYVRAYISSLTSLSGINPIILPTINLSGK